MEKSSATPSYTKESPWNGWRGDDAEHQLRTGRLVTSAALILFFAFSALASSPSIDGKVIGTALGVGILLDATIVRALLVPALVSLFGRWNWWLPGWLARILFVEPSPLAPRLGTATPPEVDPEEEPEKAPVPIP